MLQELGRQVPEISLSHLTASALWRGWEDGQGFCCPLRLWVQEWCWHQACRLGKQASPLSVPSARARQAGCRAWLGSLARQHWPLLLPRWRLGVCVGVSGRRVWVPPVLQVCLEGCAEWLGAWLHHRGQTRPEGSPGDHVGSKPAVGARSSAAPLCPSCTVAASGWHLGAPGTGVVTLPAPWRAGRWWHCVVWPLLFQLCVRKWRSGAGYLAAFAQGASGLVWVRGHTP